MTTAVEIMAKAQKDMDAVMAKALKDIDSLKTAPPSEPSPPSPSAPVKPEPRFILGTRFLSVPINVAVSKAGLVSVRINKILIPKRVWHLPLFKTDEYTLPLIENNKDVQMDWEPSHRDTWRKIGVLSRVLTVEELVKWVGLSSSTPCSTACLIMYHIDPPEPTLGRNKYGHLVFTSTYPIADEVNEDAITIHAIYSHPR